MPNSPTSFAAKCTFTALALLLAFALTFAQAAPAANSAAPKPAAQQVDPPAGSQKWMPLAQRIAERFWRERGYAHCRDELAGGKLIEIRWWPQGALGGHMASAVIGACIAGRSITKPYINVSEFIAENPWLDRCATIVHEFGHLVGLDHDARFPIMRQHDALPECFKPAKAKQKAKQLRNKAKKLRNKAKRVRFKWRRKELRRKAAKRIARAKRLDRAASANRTLRPGAWRF